MVQDAGGRVSIRKNRGRILLAPIIMGKLITILLSINLRNALPDTSFSTRIAQEISRNSSVTAYCDECTEKSRILLKRKRFGDTLKWFWDTTVRPALKTTLKCVLRFAGHTKENADATIEWAADQLHYLSHTRKYRMFARFIERRIAFVLTNTPILLRDGWNSKCFIPL